MIIAPGSFLKTWEKGKALGRVNIQISRKVSSMFVVEETHGYIAQLIPALMFLEVGIRVEMIIRARNSDEIR